MLWNPEYSTKNPESYYRLESGIQLTEDPLQIKLSYSLERKTIYVKPPQGIDLNVTTSGVKTIVHEELHMKGRGHGRMIKIL